MKKIFFSAVLLSAVWATAQNTGIGTTRPDSSAQLEINSDTKGVLFPRIELKAKNNPLPVVSPAIGLKIYNTATVNIPITPGESDNSVSPGFYFWDGTKWVRELSTNDSSNEGQLVIQKNTTDPSIVGYTLRTIRDYPGISKDGVSGPYGIPNIGKGSLDLMTDRGDDLIKYSGGGFIVENIGVFGQTSLAWGGANLVKGNFSTVWGKGHIEEGDNNTVFGGGFAFESGYIGNKVSGSLNTVSGSGNIIKDSGGVTVFGNSNEIKNSLESIVLGNNVKLNNTSKTTVLGYSPTPDNIFDFRLLNIGNGNKVNNETYSDAFTILKDAKTGINIDNFQNTNSDAHLQVNGKVLIGNFGDDTTGNNTISTAGNAKADLDVRGTVAVATLNQGTTSDRIVVADNSGILKTINSTAISSAAEPWFEAVTNTPATSNTQDIYQQGSVGIGKAARKEYFKLETQGAAAASNDVISYKQTPTTNPDNDYPKFKAINIFGTFENANFPEQTYILGGYQFIDGRSWLDYVNNNTPYGGAEIRAEAANNHSPNNKPSRIIFSTTPQNSNIRKDQMTIDDTGFIGMGTLLKPEYKLDIVSYGELSNGSRTLSMSDYSENPTAMNLQFSKARGDYENFTKSVQNGDSLGVISTQGFSGGSFIQSSMLGFSVDGTPTTEILPSKFYIGFRNQTTGGDLNNGFNSVFTILNNGNTGISTATPTEKLEVAGNIKSTSLAGTGERVVVADANGILKTSTKTIAQATSKWTNDATNQVVKLTNLSDGVTTRTDNKNIFIADNGNIGFGAKPAGARFLIDGASDDDTNLTYAEKVKNNVAVDNSGALILGDQSLGYFSNSKIRANGDLSLFSNNSQTNLHMATNSDAFNEFPAINFFRQRTNNTYAQAGDYLGRIRAISYSLNNEDIGNAGSMMLFIASENQDLNGKGSEIVFITNPNRSNSALERMRISNNGNIGINTITPTEKLEVSGKIKATNVIFTGIQEYADNSAAIAAGLQAGEIYRTGDVVKIVH